MKKLEESGMNAELSIKEKMVLSVISNNIGCKSGDIATKLSITYSYCKENFSGLRKKGRN